MAGVDRQAVEDAGEKIIGGGIEFYVGYTRIGSKKLRTIRRELEEVLAKAGGNPIENLEQMIASANRKGDRTEVLEDLKRFLESEPDGKRLFRC